MAIRNILACEVGFEEETSKAAMEYALDLSGRADAHLSVVVGVPRVVVPVMVPAMQISGLIEEENRTRLTRSRTRAEEVARKAALANVRFSTHVFSEPMAQLEQRIGVLARIHDIVVAERPHDEAPFAGDLAQALLMQSGRPVLFVPPTWNRGAGIGRIMVAWDGSATAARAVAAAMPLIETAQQVEIVSVTGAKEIGEEAPGAELAPMLARHGPKVSVVELPTGDDGEAKPILDHADLTRADLIVMGGYFHSRLRQVVFGGVTRTVLKTANVPVLMAH